MNYNKKNIICVVGLGYVGLPLAMAFGKKFLTFGYDISNSRVNNLNKKIDIIKKYKNEFQFFINAGLYGKNLRIIVSNNKN